MTKPGVCLVVGAGDATGGAVARRFAREGLVVCATRRTLDPLQPLLAQIRDAEGMAFGFGSDARKEEEVVPLIDHIESNIGPIELASWGPWGSMWRTPSSTGPSTQNSSGRFSRNATP
jgi:NAD(P)-dependent dehydrogenase (short-subunit alcohol dehydrogenase family)